MISLMNGFKRKVIKLSHELFQRSFPLTHGGFKRRVIDYKSVSYLYDTLSAAPVCHRFFCCKTFSMTESKCPHCRIRFVKMAIGDVNWKSLFSLCLGLRCVAGHALSEGLCQMSAYFLHNDGFLFTMVRRICRMRFWFQHAWFDSYNVLCSVF